MLYNFKLVWLLHLGKIALVTRPKHMKETRMKSILHWCSIKVNMRQHGERFEFIPHMVARV